MDIARSTEQISGEVGKQLAVASVREGDGMSEIAVADVEWGDGAIQWGAALRPLRRPIKSLLSAAQAQGEAGLGQPGFAALCYAAGRVHGLLGSHFRDEIEQIAEASGQTPDLVIAANLAYDAAQALCSTVACNAPDGVLHFRNLDWDFPRRLLQKHTLIARVRGAPLGDYAMITWPGFFGALTAIAPGRFSVSVNFVHHTGESSSPLGTAWRVTNGYWPVAWAVRQVLDTAPSFTRAVSMLQELPLLSPVLFMIAGIAPGQAAVIERSVVGHATRKLGQRSALLLTNHYETAALRANNVEDVDDTLNSGERRTRLDGLLGSKRPESLAAALKVLDDPEILVEGLTQQQIAMNSRTGRLAVKIPGGKRTEISLDT